MEAGLRFYNQDGIVTIDQNYLSFMYQGALNLSNVSVLKSWIIIYGAKTYSKMFDITEFAKRTGASVFAISLSTSGAHNTTGVVLRSNGSVYLEIASTIDTRNFTVYGYSMGLPAYLASGPGLRVFRGSEVVYDSRARPMKPVAHLKDNQSYNFDRTKSYAMLLGMFAALRVVYYEYSEFDTYVDSYRMVQGVKCTTEAFTAPSTSKNYYSGDTTGWLCVDNVFNAGYEAKKAVMTGSVQVIILDVTGY